MQTPNHAINWFEIPVSDFDRAKKFYESILEYEMPAREVNGVRMAFFLYDASHEGRGGAIVYDPSFYLPSENGALIYLNCESDLQPVLDQVEKAGGDILRGKIAVSADAGLGYWALIRDSEGNRVALHSMA
ncbi:VOC family protein [Taibaiella soli]|uniref:VOC family protein n=1 Tax=Taibaiella soli TaxID=1649169 RepID=A0A2W2B2B0_9BACT|nr:VOC family protein [Taibaiella soli]PZF74404.1 VOC family protein [Taibaiella soli]